MIGPRIRATNCTESDWWIRHLSRRALWNARKYKQQRTPAIFGSFPIKSYVIGWKKLKNNTFKESSKRRRKRKSYFKWRRLNFNSERELYKRFRVDQKPSKTYSKFANKRNNLGIAHRRESTTLNSDWMWAWLRHRSGLIWLISWFNSYSRAVRMRWACKT